MRVAPSPERPELTALMKNAIESFNKLSPEEREIFKKLSSEKRERVLREQGESLARNYKPGPRQAVAEAPASDFQARNAAWMRVCFDQAGDPSNLDERRDRFGEESLELIQSLGGTAEGMHQLVDYVFGRAIGEPRQEMGGTMTTLAGLATYARLDMAVCAEQELARCQQPEVIAKIRSKRSRRHGRGPLPGVEADVVTMATGCCSAVTPCSHQQRDPSTLCDVCKQSAFAEADREFDEDLMPGGFN